MNSTFRVVLVILALAVMMPKAPVAAQNPPGVFNCIVTVPSSWGEFKGTSSEFGMVFQDSAGTLRFVSNAACQISNAPSVPVISMEVRRK